MVKRAPKITAVLFLFSCALLTSSLQGMEPAITFVPETEQRQGNAAAGKHALLNKPIVSCGLPLNAFKQITQTLGGQDQTVTIARDNAEASELPFNMNLIEDKNGVQVVASNCLTCHGANLFGELVIGLGNEFMDFTVNPSEMVERAGIWVNDSNEIAAWEKFADRVYSIAPYTQMRTAGVNPANNLTFALMAHRDPVSNQWSAEPQNVMPSTSPPPVSVPPWWRMQKKHALFSMGEGQGDHARIMMSAAILCTDSLEELAELDALAVDVAAYIKSLEPPVYPFLINKPLAEEGEAVFDRTCAQCHGSYKPVNGELKTDQANAKLPYPNRLVPIEVVGTDPALIDFIYGDGWVFVDWFNRSFFGEIAQAVPSKGYVAPPLDGIWSTAPYLHNGSVPSIALMLDSTRRPTVWRHSVPSAAQKKHYNQAELGWYYDSLPVNPENVKKDSEITDKWIYDTRIYGYSNAGHQFGDSLSNSERSAVIEYLKTL